MDVDSEVVAESVLANFQQDVERKSERIRAVIMAILRTRFELYDIARPGRIFRHSCIHLHAQ